MTTRRLRLAWRGTAEDADRLVGTDRGAGLPAGAVRRLGAGSRAGSHRADADALPGGRRVRRRQRDADLDRHLGRPGRRRGWTASGRRPTALLHWVSALIAMPAIAYAGRPFFASALAAMRQRRTNMDVPISVGVAAGHRHEPGGNDRRRRAHLFRLGRSPCCSSCWSAACWTIARAARRGRRRSSCWRCARPMSPCCRRDGTTPRRGQEQVAEGDRVLVATGERIGVDGVLERGSRRCSTPAW